MVLKEKLNEIVEEFKHFCIASGGKFKQETREEREILVCKFPEERDLSIHQELDKEGLRILGIDSYEPGEMNSLANFHYSAKDIGLVIFAEITDIDSAISRIFADKDDLDMVYSGEIRKDRAREISLVLNMEKDEITVLFS
jgi:putative hemolysin